jgi:acyl carrier protein
MDNQQILGKLIVIVKSINTGAKISENSALIGESILDSLEFMNYITKVEESFSINISDTEIKSHDLGIIRNMSAHIKSKLMSK